VEVSEQDVVEEHQVAWILVSTQRKNQWGAAMSGKIIGWGRRPMLPFKLRAASFQG
jgi:hypothetical protein